VLVASGRGLRNELEGILSGLGDQIVVQRADVGWPTFSHITPAEVEKLRSLAHVRAVSVVALAATQLPDRSQAPIFGVDPRQHLVRMMRIVAGHGLTPAADEVVVGQGLARRLGLGPGDAVELAGRSRFRVAGIFETDHSLTDYALVLDVHATQRAFDLGDGVNLVFLNVDGATPTEVIDLIRRQLPTLEARPSDTWASTFRSLEAIRRYAGFLGLIALGVAALGVTTTMTVSVTERLQELGVLRAIGWRAGRVARLVLTESLVMTGAGALAGLALAWLVVQASETLALSWSAWLSRTSLHLGMLVGGITLPLAAGLIGSLPALAHVLRSRPAHALRRDA
jgi:putative ABC transport system permease protein